MAELALAIVGIAGTVEVCSNLGRTLVVTYKSFKGAEREWNERVIRLESIWFRIDAQLKFLESLWSSLDEAHRRLHHETVEILESKLKLADRKVKSVNEQNLKADRGDGVKINRWRYIRAKEGINHAIEELESWSKTFDPSWFLIMKLVDSRVDRELQSSDERTISLATSLRRAVRPRQDDKPYGFLRADELEIATEKLVPFSNFRLVQRKGSSQWRIFETVHLPEGTVSSTFARNIRDIARKLSHADPLTFQLLDCSGVIRHVDAASSQARAFTFVFRVPPGFSSPSSLRGIWNHGNLDHSLGERVSVARDLARAVSYIHSFGFVHKNIRPETIILLKGCGNRLGSPFLAGFEIIRGVEDRTSRRNDNNWHRNLYRHPQRQGVAPREDYIMQHDIYSLGVCLLELGLFQSLIRATDDEKDYHPSPLLGLSLEQMLSIEPEKLKDHLFNVAQRNMPQIMGARYTRIIVTCLTCLDEDNVDFGDESEFQDEDGILVNVRYIEKILIQLNEIVV